MECGGFEQASDAARTANQVVALATDTLTGRLAGCAAMAGNDSAGADFAAAYDAGASEAVAALADLARAFIGLGRLLAATGLHHAEAESAAAGQVLGSVSAGLTSDAYVAVTPSVPPSSLGGQEPSFGPVDRWILDHVEGFVWPSGDVDLLRDAATTWRRAAESVAGLVDHVASARAFLEVQVSSEVPVALSCLADVRSLVLDVAAELAALGTACEEHAAAIEAVHERTRALLREVASMAVEGVAISALVAALSGPLGGSLGMGALLARIRAVAPRFHALLSTLRVSVASTAARLRAGRATLADLRIRLERYARVGVRDERGSARIPGVGGRLPGRPRPDVSDAKLQNYVNDLFKGVEKRSRIGDGTTMDAIRHELRTGETVHGRRHVLKGEEILRGLTRWLEENAHASAADRDLAAQLADEIRRALNS